MIRVAGQGSPVGDDLARRIVEAIDAGRYATVPLGPARITPMGVRTDDASAWTHAGLDLVQAAGLFRWRAAPDSPRAAPESPPELPPRLRIELPPRLRVAKDDPDALPDLRLSVEADDWPDYARPSPEATVTDRIAAAGRRHLSLMRRVLASRAATPAEEAAIDATLRTVASVHAGPEDADASLTTRAACDWSPARHSYVDDSRSDWMRDLDPQPSAALDALVPRCAMATAHSRMAHEDGRVGHVEIGPLVVWTDAHERPDPVEAMRLLSRMHGTRP